MSDPIAITSVGFDGSPQAGYQCVTMRSRYATTTRPQRTDVLRPATVAPRSRLFDTVSKWHLLRGFP